jgi:acyl-CoA thioesterase-2
VSPNEDRQRVFGGQVAAQSLMAAGRTVDTGRPHSLHAYFLRPGDPTVPILYEVDRIRDGRSFTTRRVVAVQHGRAIFHLSASFHADEPGLTHQFPMPEVPDPDELDSLVVRLEPFRDTLGDWFAKPHPIDQRHIGELPFSRNASRDPVQRLWIRADGDLPDDPLLHACIATYASDMSLFDTMLAPHNVSWDDADFMGASLDHCMWFHRPFRADEWLLYDMDSPTAYGARGLARGLLFTRGGDLAVSMVQEGLMRMVPRRPGD